MDDLEKEESMDVDARGGANGDSDFEVDYNRKKAAKKAKKPKSAADFTTVYDQDDESEEIKKKNAPPKQPKAPRQPRKPKEVTQHNPNMIKTSNKLIGEIENKDLYNSDDEP